MNIAVYEPISGQMLEQTRTFLGSMGLDWETGIQLTVLLTENDEIAATGSIDGNVLKCIAVAPERQGDGLAAIVVSELYKCAAAKGSTHLFLFTKPDNSRLFAGLGFYEVMHTDDALLMENKRGGIQKFVQGLTPLCRPCKIGAIVANCNPFTNGHKFLVESAAAQCDLLHLFILSEDKSLFSFADRFTMAQSGTSHLKNVVLHPTGPYQISLATFPSYFLKDKAVVRDVSCALDLKIFALHFAKPMGITHRYVGTEPRCEITAAYNAQMKEILPTYGIEVIEIERVAIHETAISASHVRELLRKGRSEELRSLVPETTYHYLEGMKRYGL